MSERFSAVFVRFGKDDPKAKVYMFEAPYYSSIEVDDEVKVQGGDKVAQVVAVEQLDLQYNSDKDQFKLLQQIAGVTELPLKRVLAVIKVTELKYEENEDGSHN